METVKIKKETFDKVADFKSKNPDCKNFDDALGLMISDLENEIKIQKDEAIRFQNGLHDKNNQLDKKQQEINSLIEKGTNGTQEQAETINRLSDELNGKETEISELKKENENLKQSLIDSECRNEQLQEIQNNNGLDATKYTLQIDKLNETINSLQSKVDSYEQTDKSNRIQMLQPVQQIMDLVAEKLSAKYNQQISVADIINKMCLRYNVERWTEWFYPFCVNDKEIEQITGKTTDELKQFFNGK